MFESSDDACKRNDSIPDDLKSVLSKFAIEYLTLLPSDMTEFGLQFFKNMQSHRRQMSKMRRANASLRLSMSQFNDGSDSESVKDVASYNKTDTETAHLCRVLLETDYFRNHCDDGIFNAINHMYSLTIEAGEKMELKDDCTLYVIENGTLNIIAGDSHTKIDENFGSFSLMQLKWKFGQNDLSITTDSDCMLWVLDSAVFQRCWIGDVHIRCRDYESILELSPIFSGLAEIERQMLADLMITKRYQPGDVIFDAKIAVNEAPGCYFILEGLVSLAMNDDDSGIQTGLLKSGQHFGEVNSKDEMILRSATAMTKVRCAYLNADSIKDLIRDPFSRLWTNLCSRCKNEF